MSATQRLLLFLCSSWKQTNVLLEEQFHLYLTPRQPPTNPTCLGLCFTWECPGSWRSSVGTLLCGMSLRTWSKTKSCQTKQLCIFVYRTTRLLLSPWLMGNQRQCNDNCSFCRTSLSYLLSLSSDLPQPRYNGRHKRRNLLLWWYIESSLLVQEFQLGSYCFHFVYQRV